VRYISKANCAETN